MADTAAALVIQLSADVKSFQREMRNATGVFDGEARKIERRQAKLKANVEAGFASMGKRVAGLVGAGAILAFTRNLVQMGDQLQDTAAQLGVTVQQLQGLDYAARATGAGQDTLTKALGVLTDQLGDAEKGEGNLAKMMAERGVKMGTAMQVVLDFADQTKKATTQNEKMAIATGLFSKSGRELIPLMEQGADGIRRLFDEASKKGQIWDTDTIDKLGRATDEFENLKKSLTGKLADPFAAILKSLTEIVDYLDKHKILVPLILGGVGAAGGAVVGGPWGALIGGAGGVGAGIWAQMQGPSASAPGSAAVGGTGGNRPPVIVKADAEKAARDAQRVVDILRQAQLDAEKAKTDGLDTASDVLRTQVEGKLQAAQGSVNFPDVQKQSARELADIDIEALESRRKLAEKELEDRHQDNLEKLRDAKATKDQLLQLEESYQSERFHLEQDFDNQIYDRRQQLASDIQSIRTPDTELLDNIRDGFVDIGVAARHGLGDLGDIAQRALDQLIDLAIQLKIMRPLAEALFGASGTSGGGLVGGLFKAIGLPFFASGTNYAPGGPAVVGERGPELVNLPRGSTVTPAAATRSALGSKSFYFDLRGAVMTQDLLNQMNAIGKQAANEGASRGASMALRAQPLRAGSFNNLGT